MSEVITLDMMLDENLTVGDAVASFVSYPEGAELADQWGAATPRNVCIFFCKVYRALHWMPPGERHAAAAWMAGLNVSTVVAAAQAFTK